MGCTNTFLPAIQNSVDTDRNSFSAKQKQRKKYIDQNNCITHANSVIFVTLKTEKRQNSINTVH